MKRISQAGRILLLGFGLTVLLNCGRSPSGPELPASRLVSAPAPKPSPKLHSGGVFGVTYRGVSVPSAAPNDDGPYVSRAADLDEGRELPRTTEATDITIVVNARNLKVTLSTASGVRSAEIGHAVNHPSECADVLANATEPMKVANRQAPTGYACLQTNEGRLCEFQVLSVFKRPVKPDKPDELDIFVTVEYRTAEK